MMFTVVFLCIASGTTAFPVQTMCGHFGCIPGQREQGVHSNDISIHRNKIDSTFNGLNAGDFATAVRHFNAASKESTAIGAASAGPSIIRQHANTEALDLLSNGIESRFVGFDPEKLTAALDAAASSRTQKGGQSLSMESELDSKLTFSWENPTSVINPATATGFNAKTITSATQDIREPSVAAEVSQPFVPNEASIQSANIQHQNGIVGLISSGSNHGGVSTSELNANIDETGRFVHFPNHNSGSLAGLFTNGYNQNNPVVDQILIADTDASRPLWITGSSTDVGPSEIIGTQSMPSRKVSLLCRFDNPTILW